MPTLLGTEGTLASAQSGTGASANAVLVGQGCTSLIIQGSSAGAANTWTIEQSIDGGVTWESVTTSSGAILSLAADATHTLLNPLGLYRTNVTTSASNFTARFLKGQDR